MEPSARPLKYAWIASMFSTALGLLLYAAHSLRGIAFKHEPFEIFR
jgi:hypothetical protein